MTKKLLLKNKKFIRGNIFFFCFIALFSFPVFTSAQNRVSGTVKDNSGSPLDNVSVAVKNTSRGTSTDASGHFSMIASPKDILVFSFIGYTPLEVPVKGQSSFPNIILIQENSTLSDVVIVGYGTQKKANVVGAIATIDGKSLENRPVTNALAGLQGISPGVTVTRSNGQPGSEGYSLQIRGFSSVNGSSALVLIDGVPGTISTMNPDDIESISVLKDAAAASIYGARAAGGVLLITTKKGISGKTSISYSGLFGTQKAINIPGRLHSWQEAEMGNEARINAGQSPPYTAQQIQWMKDSDTNYIVNPNNPNDYQYYYDLDQRPIVLRNSTPMQDHNISVRGGGKKDNYYFSLGYYGQQGIFKLGPDNSNRTNARFNYSNRISDIFTLDARLAYRQTNTLTPSSGTSNIYSYLYTTRMLYPTFFPGTTDKYINDNSGNFAYAYLKEGGANKIRNDEGNAQVILKAKDFVKGISLSAAYSPSIVLGEQNVIYRTIPRYNIAGIGSYMNNPNSFTKNRNVQLSNNVQVLADFDKQIAESHNFHLLAGYAYEDQRNDNTSATAKNLTSNEFFTLGLGDPTQATNSESVQTWGLESYFGRFDYRFKNKYLFEANLRYDGSSKLAPNNRWHAFPSLALGWRVSQEEWFANALPFINEFKLRGSWGKLGNSDGVIGNYDYIALLSRGGTYSFNNVSNLSYYQSTLASPDKTWETIETSDVGVDLTLFDKRLTFTADYYVKHNNDMLAPLQLSSIIGIGTSTYNVASLRTEGWEMNVGWKSNASKNFSYWVNANLSDNQNKVISYNGQSSVGGGVNGIIEGFPINTVWGYKADGIIQNESDLNKFPKYNNAVGIGDIKYIDINGDGKINSGLGRVSDHGDLVELGNTSPRYTYGFSFGVAYKGIELSTMFQGVGERTLFLDASTLYPFTSSWVMPMDFNLDYWTPTNTNAKFPRLYLGGSQNTARSSYWVMNGAYLRLKNLQVAYNLPTPFIKKIHLTGARVYFSGQDLWEVSKMWLKAFDPEEPSNASWQYPFFRTYSVGINLNF